MDLVSPAVSGTSVYANGLRDLSCLVCEIFNFSKSGHKINTLAEKFGALGLTLGI